MSETTTEATAEAGAPAEDATPLGWLNTADHKRIGRLFIVTSILFGVLGLVLDLLVRIDLTDGEAFVALDVDTFAQVFALSRETLVLLFLIPAFLGVACYVVPLQIGASNLAFPRAAAASYWGWLVSAGVLIGAYAGNGGPYGGWSDGVDLHLLALGGIVLSLLIGAVTIGTTVLTMRSPGLYLDRTPPFSWSAMVTASMLVISLPVLLGQLVLLYVDHRYGRVFLGGNQGIWRRIDWVHETPQLFIYVVPVLGAVAEIKLAASRRRVFEPLAVYFTLGLVGLFGFGAWANFSVTGEGVDIADGLEGIVLVALYGGALLGSTVLFGVLGFTLFQGRKGLKVTAPLIAATLAIVFVLAGAALGLVGAGSDWLELAGRGNDGNPYLRDTVFTSGVQSLLIYGAGVMGLIAALHWWGPKIWGRRLNEAGGFLTVLVAAIGALLATLGPVLSGVLTEQPDFVYFDPSMTSIWSSWVDSSGAAGFMAMGVAGAVITAVAVGLLLLNVIWSVLLGKGVEAGNDPWSAQTPEWLLASPPPMGDGALADLTSGTPLLDASEVADEEVTV